MRDGFTVVIVSSSARKIWFGRSSGRVAVLVGLAIVALLFTLALAPPAQATPSPGPDTSNQLYRSKDSAGIGAGPAMPWGYTSIIGAGGVLVPGTCAAGACGTANTMLDDQFSTSCLPLGFPTFKYYGTSYNCVWVHSNAFMIPDNSPGAMPSVTNAQSWQPLAIPNPTPPNNMIAPFWVDTYGSFCPKTVGGGIYYKSTATAFYLEFRDVLLQDDTFSGANGCLNNIPANNPSPTYITFQAILYPDSLTTVRQNAIEVFLLSAKGPLNCAVFIYCEATIGVENSGGNLGLQYGYGTATYTNRAVRFFPNHGPAAQPVSATATNGGPSVAMTLSGIDPDLDSDAADTFAISTDVPAGQGTLSITGSTATFTPHATYCTTGPPPIGPVTFQYTASNTLPPSPIVFTGAPATGSITVTCAAVVVNVAPTAVCGITTPPPRTVDLPVTFGSGSSTDSDGTVVAWDWAFPSGSPATAAVASPSSTWSTVGIYTPTLRVQDDDGAWSTVVNCPNVDVLAVDDPGEPTDCTFTADFTATRGPIQPGDPVTFADTTTHPSTTLETWLWDFGDGYTSTTQSLTHTYAAAGDYAVVLSVTDDIDCESTHQEMIHVAWTGTEAPLDEVPSGESEGTSPPVVYAGDDVVVKEAAAVKLIATATGPRTPFTFTWRQVSGPTVAFTNAGVAEPEFVAPALPNPAEPARLVFAVYASDGAADSEEDTVEVRVVAKNQQPPIAMAGKDVTVQKGGTVVLDGSGSSDPDGDALTFSWAHAGGAPVATLTGTGATAAVTAPVDAPGGFIDIELTVDDGAFRSADTVRIWLESPPQILTGFQATTLEDGSVLFVANAASTEYAWDFGDGETLRTADATASHVYTSPGTYDVQLRLASDAEPVSQQVTPTVPAAQYSAPVRPVESNSMPWLVIAASAGVVLTAGMFALAIRHRKAK